ncbi:Basic-leucine zipper domain [Phaffia rhodozyma]|uniref:Basic-leucine zipper domain n=1 Tax=Phaffia rhodozyma TaxID=264483 RepID=A0A0F7SJZ6_PHARH|nr:Basic-leucine zipper domain [Phaffia rhodozyma]
MSTVVQSVPKSVHINTAAFAPTKHTTPSTVPSASNPTAIVPSVPVASASASTVSSVDTESIANGHKKRKQSSPSPSSLNGGSDYGGDDDELTIGSGRAGGGPGERIGSGTGPGEVNEPGISVSESRRRARVLRNRASAQRSRDAKKNHQSALEERVQELEALLAASSLPGSSVPVKSAPQPSTSSSLSSESASPLVVTSVSTTTSRPTPDSLLLRQELENDNLELRTRVVKLEGLIRGLVGFLERGGVQASALQWNPPAAGPVSAVDKSNKDKDQFPILDFSWDGPELVRDQGTSAADFSVSLTSKEEELVNDQVSQPPASAAPALSDFSFSPPSSPFDSSFPLATMSSPGGSPDNRSRSFLSLSPSASPSQAFALFPTLSSEALDPTRPLSPDYASFLNLPPSQGTPIIEPISSTSSQNASVSVSTSLSRQRDSFSSVDDNDFLDLSPMSFASDDFACPSSSTTATISTPASLPSSALGLDTCLAGRTRSTVTHSLPGRLGKGMETGGSSMEEQSSIGNTPSARWHSQQRVSTLESIVPSSLPSSQVVTPLALPSSLSGPTTKTRSAKTTPCLRPGSPISPISLPPSMTTSPSCPTSSPSMPPSPLILPPPRSSITTLNSFSTRRLPPSLKRLPSITLNISTPGSPASQPVQQPHRPASPMVRSKSSSSGSTKELNMSRLRTSAHRSGLGRGSRFLAKVLQGTVIPGLPNEGGQAMLPPATSKVPSGLSTNTKLEIVRPSARYHLVPQSLLAIGQVTPLAGPSSGPWSRPASKSPQPRLGRTHSNPLLTLPEWQRIASDSTGPTSPSMTPSGPSSGSGSSSGTAWLVKRDEMNPSFGTIGFGAGRTAAAC